MIRLNRGLKKKLKESIEQAEKNKNQKIDPKIKKFCVELMEVIYKGAHEHAKEDIIKLIDGSEKISMGDLKEKITRLKIRDFKE